MSMMDVCGPVFCPDCAPTYRRSNPKHRVGVVLECSSSNYSGCGVDMANCPECGKGYQISYKVGEVTRAENWDVDMEAERRAAEERRREQRLELLQTKLKQLEELQNDLGQIGQLREELAKLQGEKDDKKT